MITKGHVIKAPHSDFQPLLSDGSMRSKWMPRREKFSEKSDWAFSSWNYTWDGAGLEGEEEDAPEQIGFRDGVDLRLGAIEQANARKKEREGERETIRKAPTL